LAGLLELGVETRHLKLQGKLSPGGPDHHGCPQGSDTWCNWCCRCCCSVHLQLFAAEVGRRAAWTTL